MSLPQTSDPATVHVIHGDSRAVLAETPAGTFDAVVTDPPYEINIAMNATAGAAWDRSGIATDPTFWAEVLRVTKPGGHLLAFGAPRRVHRVTAAIEDAGWEIREQLVWAYATAFPHSVNMAKAIDEIVGAEPLQLDREWLGDANRNLKRVRRLHRVTAPSSTQAQRWRGWGTGLRPAWEPIVVGRKPIDQPTTAHNLMVHGTGAMNIEATKVAGKWTPNLFATDPVLGRMSPFFLVNRARGRSRAGADHPTVKPTDLMLQLLLLVTPPGGHVLDPFAGSGSTGVAAKLLGFDATLIEQDEGYARQARERVDLAEPL